MAALSTPPLRGRKNPAWNGQRKAGVSSPGDAAWPSSVRLHPQKGAWAPALGGGGERGCPAHPTREDRGLSLWRVAKASSPGSVTDGRPSGL